MSDLHEALGARLHELRTAAGLTQAEIGKAVGLSRSSIANIESGKQGDIGVTLLVALAEALGTNVHGLIGTAPETIRINRAEDRLATLEDQVRRLVHTLNAAGGALQAFDLAVQTSRVRPLKPANPEEITP